MKLKYKSKIYNSNDVPFFIYFENDANRLSFVDDILHSEIDVFRTTCSVRSIIAGDAIIKDKRSKIYFCFENPIERKIIMKTLFTTDDENALLLSPPDIDIDVITRWVDNNIENI